MKTKPKGQFYFSLFRALVLLAGGDPRRSESNHTEATLVGLFIFLIHYLFFATHFISPELGAWLTALFLVVLIFWVWIFWLLLVYFNSLIIRVMRFFAVFRAFPQRRLQSVLWIGCTTIMAGTFLNGNQFLHEIAALWLVAVAMNLVAAAILALSNASHESGE